METLDKAEPLFTAFIVDNVVFVATVDNVSLLLLEEAMVGAGLGTTMLVVRTNDDDDLTGGLREFCGFVVLLRLWLLPLVGDGRKSDLVMMPDLGSLLSIPPVLKELVAIVNGVVNFCNSGAW